MPRLPEPKLLVIGANGFVGSSVADYFRAAGRPVATASHRPPADILFDLREPEPLLGRLPSLDVSTALICSGISDIDRCARERELTWDFNVTRICALISGLQRSGIAVVFCSTDMAFAGDRGGYRETDVPDPVTEYGRQKVAVEKFIGASAGAILRMSKLYSLTPADGSVVHQMLGTLSRGGSLRAATDQTIVPTSVEDVARTVAAIVDRRLTGVVHVTPGVRYSRYDFACRVAEAVGKKDLVVPCSIDEFSFLEKRPKKLWLESVRGEAFTGVRPAELADVLGDIVSGVRA